MPRIETFFFGKGGWSSDKPGKGWEQKVGDNLPACSDKIADKAGNKNKLKMALFRGNTTKNYKRKKGQHDLDVEAGSTTIRAEGPKADRVKGVAQSHTGKVKEDGPRPDGAKLDRLVIHGNAKNKKECGQNDG